MDIGAITNGYDLDSYIDLLKEFSFKNLQITLDGKKEVNDRRRIHKDTALLFRGKDYHGFGAAIFCSSYCEGTVKAQLYAV